MVINAGDPALYPLTITDDTSLGFGGVVSALWDTTDDNANMLKVDLPAGGGVDVPVVLFGIGIKAVDLTFLAGTTEPMIGVVDADRDSYIALGFLGDDTARIRGAYNRLLIQPDSWTDPTIGGTPFNPFGNIQTVQVTTGPEAGQFQAIYHSLAIGATNTQNWTNFSGGLQTTVSKFAIASGATGTINSAYCYTTFPIVDGMTVTELTHYYVGDAAVTAPGVVTSQYGFRCDALGGGGAISSWAIYIASDLSYFGGDVQMADTTSIRTGTGDNDYFMIKADDLGVGVVEIARAQGAAEPWFGIGKDSDVVKATYDDKLGFFSTTPIAKPTLVADDVANVITALVNLGLINAAA